MPVQLRPGPDEGTWFLPVRVTPKGGKDVFLPLTAEDTAIKVKVAAPPEKGEANAAVEALIAKTLGIPKSTVQVVKGETSRQKQVLIAAAWSLDELKHRLALATSGEPEWFENPR
jgi:uncharacterized protein